MAATAHNSIEMIAVANAQLTAAVAIVLPSEAAVAVDASAGHRHHAKAATVVLDQADRDAVAPAEDASPHDARSVHSASTTSDTSITRISPDFAVMSVSAARSNHDASWAPAPDISGR